MNSSWKTLLCCYGESGKRVTQIYKYHTQTKPDNKCIYQKTRLQYKTEIHSYIKIVNLKFIFNVSFYYFNLLISMDVWSIVRSTPHHMRCFISHGLLHNPQRYIISWDSKSTMDFLWKERRTKPTKSRTCETSQPVIRCCGEKERRSGWVGKKKESCNIRMPYVLEPKCIST